MRARTRLLPLSGGLLAAVAVSLTFATPAVAYPVGYRIPVRRLSAPPAAPAASTVTAVPGDSLWAIGHRVNRTWAQLAGYNAIADPNLIDVGQVLRIPPKSYRPPPPTPPPTPPPAPVVVTVAVTTPPPQPPPPPAPIVPDGGIWACIAHYESGGDWSIDTGNGYSGGLQFTVSSWAAAGGLAYAPAAYLASETAQIAVAQRLQQMQGWGAWPVSSVRCGL